MRKMMTCPLKVCKLGPRGVRLLLFALWDSACKTKGVKASRGWLDVPA
jgi:hypothetical protein